MIQNPAYRFKDGANIYSDRESALYQQLDMIDNTVQNISYQVPHRGAIKPATQTELYQETIDPEYSIVQNGSQALPATSVEPSEEPQGDNSPKQMKTKNTVATIVIAAVALLTTVLALLGIVIVAVLYTSTSNYNQEIQVLNMDIENLRTRLRFNETQGKMFENTH